MDNIEKVISYGTAAVKIATENNIFLNNMKLNGVISLFLISKYQKDKKWELEDIKIETWRWGLCVPFLYDKFKIWVSDSIDGSYYKMPMEVSKEDLELLTTIIKTTAHFNGWELQEELRKTSFYRNTYVPDYRSSVSPLYIDDFLRVNTIEEVILKLFELSKEKYLQKV